MSREKEQELRRRVCQEARSWEFTREGSDRHRAILAAYNAIRPLPGGYRMQESDPWCAAFVSAVGERCGLGSVLLPECSCERMLALYRARGRTVQSSRVQPGDLVFYDWDKDGKADHVGLVLDAETMGAHVIEGNHGDAVSTRRVVFGNPNLLALVSPDYGAAARTGAAGTAGSKSASKSAAGAGQEPRVEPAFRKAPVLRRGRRGEAVVILQQALELRGFLCGLWGADGVFGPDTERALLDFQRSRGLEPDGVVGPVTWTALLSPQWDSQ